MIAEENLYLYKSIDIAENYFYAYQNNKYA